MAFRLLTLVACACLTAAAAAQPAPKDATAAFKVATQAKITMTVGDREETIDADAAFEYTWKRDGKVRTLVVDSATVRAAAGGKEMLNAKMSRAGFVGGKGGNKTEVKTEDAPEQLKAMLTDSFGSPICKVELDAAGKEVKRTIVAGPGAKTLIDTGMVANATLFHPWYPVDKDEWQDKMEVSTGNGLASGKVTYTKIPGGKDGQAVKVAGTLAADGVKTDNGFTVKDGKYVVSGRQTYDATRREWIAGSLTLDISFKLTNGTEMLGSAKGTMTVTFEMLPAQKR
jgi:hypothetical protein